MALTATAMPRIQQDIIQTLHMSKNKNNLVTCLKSFDRTNLAIKVFAKDGVRSAMEPLVQELLSSSSSQQPTTTPVGSTIVYCPTKAQVEEVASFLQQRLQSSCPSNQHKQVHQVEYYHADLSTQRRHETHLRFLTGQTTVVVATIAFGMGIDKPDTRRVIHYGPPKTVEEYYQQIGRAGRDGLPAECILYCSAADFDRYSSDFYLHGLNPQARQATMHSTAALKRFAMNREQCRRKSLLEFFDETPPFGDWCGTCDVCCSRTTYGEDATREFGPVARFILSAVDSLAEQGLTTLLQVLSGKIVDSYRYKRHVHPPTLQATLEKEEEERRRNSLGGTSKRLTNEQLKEFIAALIQKKYISEVTKRGIVNGQSRNWTVLVTTAVGVHALKTPHESIRLPVPESIRKMEQQAEIKRQRVLQQLQDSGVEISKLPQKEIEDGDGEVIRAYLKWNRRLEALEKSDKIERLDQLRELFQIIQNWRSDAAMKLQMAPANILAEHLLFAIAYTAQSLPAGMTVTVSDLEQTGARNRLIPTLASDINAWLAKYQTSPPPAMSTSADSDENHEFVLPFPSGQVQATKWAYAVYRPNKKTGVASWESSYLRFSKGESPMAIAMAPTSGKPLAVTTVIGHIQEAVIQGRSVDLQRLSSFAAAPLPTKSQWYRLEEAETEMQMSVTGDPSTSGVDGGAYSMTALLQPIMGKEFTEKPYDQRTDHERQEFNSWCQALQWYQLLKRAGISPQFGKGA
jgi:superfamily II DNA helicase RecQ